MIKRRNAYAAPSINRDHIVEDGSRAGELVRIIGTEGVVLSGIFCVRLHAYNTNTGSEWVEMREVGGSKEFRAVRPNRIRPATKSELRNRGIAS
ncbi:MAG: hypothetical protein ACREMY_09600 [bacterium]